jgi:MFS family permease
LTILDFLTNAGLILPVGQIMTFSSTKTVYLTAVIVFEIGSLLCGVAPNIDFLIFGRAIAGCGAAG